jgi:hypothetical protein
MEDSSMACSRQKTAATLIAGNAKAQRTLTGNLAARYEFAPLIEPFLIQDVFSSGIARIEAAGEGFFRLVIYVNQEEEGARPVRVIVSRLIVPTSAFEDGIKKIRDAVAKEATGMLAPEIMGRA